MSCRYEFQSATFVPELASIPVDMAGTNQGKNALKLLFRKAKIHVIIRKQSKNYLSQKKFMKIF